MGRIGTGDRSSPHSLINVGVIAKVITQKREQQHTVEEGVDVIQLVPHDTDFLSGMNSTAHC